MFKKEAWERINTFFLTNSKSEANTRQCFIGNTFHRNKFIPWHINGLLARIHDISFAVCENIWKTKTLGLVL